MHTPLLPACSLCTKIGGIRNSRNKSKKLNLCLLKSRYG